MLEIKDISKSYTTGSFTQHALDHVSIAFRDNEFAAILGPSGSGKTTLLNIIGGLDHYDSGDLVIDGVSTKRYKDRDWDTYRNHRVGFIFQSYNLIPHQTVLANVELALTLSGVPRSERRKRALAALGTVGLAEHVSKKPNQLSGGQMQRVAIARALVNDPSIVLADEPTGALDTETGIQVMNILKEVARDRLVVMVTHNPDLAHQYATRIVNLTDGHITGDSDPLDPRTAATGMRPATAAGAGAAGAAAGATTGAAAARAATAHAVNTAANTSPTSANANVAGSAGGSASAASHATARAASDGPDASAASTSGTASTARPPRGGKAAAGAKPDRKASMSFLTALSLSFNNLMTKKGRTFLTAFAGSIGIIGIAAILALSNGVNNYIADTEEQALTSYPLTITKSSFDMSSLLSMSMGGTSSTTSGSDSASDDSASSGTIPQSHMMSDMFAQVKNNDLASFKEFLDSGDSGIEQYVSTITYDYGIVPQVYSADTSDGINKINPSSFASTFTNGMSGSAFSSNQSGMNSFTEMMGNSDVLDSQMDVVAGRWPQNANEAVLVLAQDGSISDYTLYSLGVYDTDQMNAALTRAMNGEDPDTPDEYRDFSYDDALGLHFKVVPANRMYQHNDEQNTWTDLSKDTDYMKEQIDNGIDLSIVGVVKPKDTATASALTEGVAYTTGLTRELMDDAASSEIVQEQLADRDTDVFTGKTFEELQSDQGGNLDFGSLFTVDEQALQNAFSFDTSALSSMGSGSDLDLSGLDLSSAMSGDASSFDFSSMDTSALSSLFDADTMQQIMANAPAFDPTQFDLGSVSDVDRQALIQASNQVAGGFAAWLMQDPTRLSPNADFNALFQQYVAENPSVLDGMSQAMGAIGQQYQQAIQTAMQSYMTNQFAPYLAQAMQSLMTQAAQVMATQLAQQMQAQMVAATDSIGTALATAISSQLNSQMAQLSSAMESGFSVDPEAFANAIQFNMSQEDLTSLLTNYMNADQLTYDNNMAKLGYADPASPSSISIYPIDFPAKEQVISIIDNYNQQMTDAGDSDRTIEYSDIMGTLMKSVTRIVDTVSLVLIAFVGISLVVSSIMIAIITYISVLERKKEIGILRAMGASKRNVGNVFNAETILEGLIAGVFAILVVYIASVPVNAFVLEGWKVPNVMALPVTSALILIGISVLLTFVAGLIPSSMAARRDPVEALRSE